jgi:hypothetical protein
LVSVYGAHLPRQVAEDSKYANGQAAPSTSRIAVQ